MSDSRGKGADLPASAKATAGAPKLARDREASEGGQAPRRPWWLASAVALVGVVVCWTLGAGAQAQSPSEASIAAGRRIYLQKADCQACHGWAGDGEKMDSQAPDGANLRMSQLDRDQLVFVIKCGLPGRDMPAFDRLAYTDDRCLGRTRADLRRMGLELFDPGATLQSREVERLTDFLLAKVVRQGSMDRAKCIDFWGEEVDVCSEFPR